MNIETHPELKEDEGIKVEENKEEEEGDNFNNEIIEETNQPPNEDMHSTFLNNNEQIIADLANLEMEQERQIFRIIFDTFKTSSGVVEFEDL